MQCTYNLQFVYRGLIKKFINNYCIYCPRKFVKHPFTMQVQESPISPKPKSSLFRKMREATIRPKNYSSFQTVDSPDPPQCVKKKDDEWAISWMRTNHRSIPVQENKAERKLREENEKLKQRLNSANNAIRDLENVCKKHQDPIPQRFCSVQPKKYREKQNARIDDDNSLHSSAVTSQTSTVKMGSSTRNKKRNGSSIGKGMKAQNSAEKEPKPSRFKPSCYKSFVFGPKLRQKLAQKEMEASQDRASDVTPPCTPERSSRGSNEKKSALEVHDILTDISNSLLGIRNVNPDTLSKEERRKKLLSFSRLSSQINSSRHKKDGDVQYKYDGAYPIDIYQAHPISSEDSSDEFQLPAIQESLTEAGFSSDENDRAEI